MKMSRKTRLVQYLSRTGEFEEREDAARSIMHAHITVDGKVTTNPNYEIKETAKIALNGRPVVKLRKIYLALNKPAGIFCQKSKDREAKTIYSFIHKKRLPLTGKEINSLFSVGRLDQDTTGLLMITNDGKLNELMMRPERKTEKTYIAALEKEISEDAVEKLRSGVIISVEDFDEHEFEYQTKPCSAEKLPGNQVKITITEGKKRQVRLMLGAVFFSVVSLKRISIGKLSLEKLGIEKEGDIKEITEKEAYSF
jgi:pseudouridine synthase